MSGGQVFVLKLGEAVVRRGHSFDLITRRVGDACRDYIPDGVNVIIPKSLQWHTGAHLVNSFLDMAFAGCLCAYIPDDADVVCVHSDAALPALYTYKRILNGKLPCVYYCYQPTQFAYNLTWQKTQAYAPLGYLIPLLAPGYRVFDKKSASCADAIITFSRAYSEWCKRLYKIDGHYMVPPGADVSSVQAADPDVPRVKHGLGRSAKIVLTVNKLICQKNVDLFIRAMANVVKRCPDAVACIVGDGPEKRRLTKLSRGLGLTESIIFTGYLKEWRDVCDYYAAASVHVFLEMDVPFGMTVIEAANFGKPSVAVRSGGVLDTVIDGKTGLLVDKALNVAEIAEKIIALLENDNIRKMMGEKAKVRAAEFTWERCGESFCAVMRETMETAARKDGTGSRAVQVAANRGHNGIA